MTSRNSLRRLLDEFSEIIAEVEEHQEEGGEREEVYILNTGKDDLEPISFYSRLLKNVAKSVLPIFRIYTPTGELPREVERIIAEEKENADTRVKGE